MRYQEWHSKADELYKQGYSGRKIADVLGMSKTQVNDYLRYAFRGEERASEAVKGVDEGNHLNGANKQRSGPKILVLDIETKQMLMGGWGLFNQNFSIDQIEEDWSILSYSAMWYDEDVPMYEDVTTQTEDSLLWKLHDLLNEADFTITHNGRRFDHKKIRARMVARGLPPHKPVRIIDTCEIARKEFGFSSNKLMYLTNLLCKKHIKSDHAKFSGYLLWKEFLKGNPEAIQEMREYNMIDVLSLKELYDILAPWSSTLPNFSVYFDDVEDMSDWEEEGFVFSNLGKYKCYRNKKTGQYRRGRTNLLSKEKRQSLLANIA